MKYTFQQLKEMYAKVPPGVKDIMYAEETEHALQEIGTSHHLRVDQIGAVGDEAHLIMLGAQPRSGFKERLVTEARIEPSVAEAIVKEVEERVFQPIRSHIRSETSGEEDVETLPPPAAAVKPPLRDLALSEAAVPPAPLESPSAPAEPAAPAAIPEEASPFMPPPAEPESSPIPAPAPAKPAVPASTAMISAKLGAVQYGKEKTTETTPNVPSAPGYNLDPYREPIE